MKHVWGAVIFSVLLGGFVRAEDQKLEKIKVQLAITGKHTKVFGVDNLFKKRLEDVNEWQQVIAVVRQFVAQEGAGDELLSRAMVLCERANNELVHCVRSTYLSLFSEGQRLTEIDIERARVNIDRARANIARVNGYLSELKDTGDRLKGQRYFRNKQRADVRDILVILLMTIETTIEKMKRDFERRLVV